MSIHIDNLFYTYMKGSPFQKKALDGISLEIGDGEFVGIIGHTGSGKSTLIQHFNGLLKPDSGKVVIDGCDITGKNLGELRRKVGIVFQYPEYQFFEETVYKDIAFGLGKKGLPQKEIETRVCRATDAVGLSKPVLAKSPFELSGGQKKRLAIAEILVMEPSILVLDEPTAGLDPKGRDDIFNFISKLHADTASTIIIVSHYMEDIARLVNRIVVLNKGKVDMDGSPGDIFNEVERLEGMGLSAPQVTYLMRRLNKIFPEIRGNIYTIDEARAEILKYIKRRSAGLC